MRATRFLLVAATLAGGCKSPTPADQVGSILSWISTAGATGEAWLRHTTPDTYSRQTLELSGATILQISTELLKAPPSSVDSASLHGVITRTREHIAQMARLVQARNSPEFALELDSLRADQKIVKQLSD